MNRCLLCGQPIEGSFLYGSHSECLSSFFGKTGLSEIPSSFEAFRLLMEKSMREGGTLSGVQTKLSLEFKSKGKKRPTLKGRAFLLKPETDRFPEIARLEFLSMRLAREVGIEVPDFALLLMDDARYVYAVRRMDRVGDMKIHMEDFCQLSGKSTEDKYRATYESCASIIKEYSAYPAFDLIAFFRTLVFSFLTLNSDMHLKNFSLLEGDEIRLSPAYDLLPASLLVDDEDELALTLGGKKRNLHRGDFLRFAERIGMEKEKAGRLIDDLVDKLQERLPEILDFKPLDEKTRTNFVQGIKGRIERLK